EAARAISFVEDEEAPGLVPALAEMLASPDPPIRLEAAARLHALGRPGPAFRPAVPALLRLLADADGRVRGHARGAVRQIDPEALEPHDLAQVAALACQLAGGDVEARVEAARRLAETARFRPVTPGGAAAAALPVLRRALADPDQR